MHAGKSARPQLSACGQLPAPSVRQRAGGHLMRTGSPGGAVAPLPPLVSPQAGSSREPAGEVDKRMSPVGTWTPRRTPAHGGSKSTPSSPALRTNGLHRPPVPGANMGLTPSAIKRLAGIADIPPGYSDLRPNRGPGAASSVPPTRPTRNSRRAVLRAHRYSTDPSALSARRRPLPPRRRPETTSLCVFLSLSLSLSLSLISHASVCSAPQPRAGHLNAARPRGSRGLLAACGARVCRRRRRRAARRASGNRAERRRAAQAARPSQRERAVLDR